VASTTNTCKTVTTGPALVASCVPAVGDATNSFTTTTCATTTSGPTSVTSCTAALASATNSYVTTVCSGITPGSQAYAVTSGPDGNIWFTEFVARRVGKFDVVTKMAVEYGPLTAPATAIAAGPDGNVWFTENTGPSTAPVIGNITPAGVITEITQGLDAGATLGALTAGPDGNVWFTKIGAGGSAIGKLDPVSGTITYYSAGLLGTSPLFGGITAGPDGNVWFTDYFSALIGSITPTGTISEYGSIVPNSPFNAITTGPLVGGSKTLWFTDPTAQAIGRATLP
jgi:streptogramin lyase